MKVESINGFRIGDKVRLKDGDGRPHIIKFFEIDGFKELFCVVHCEDGTEAMLHEISLLEPQGIDEAAEEYTKLHVTIFPDSSTDRGTRQRAFKAGAKFQAEQGYSREVEVKEDAGGYPYINEIELYDYDNDKPLAKKGDKIRIQITKVD